MRLKKSLLVLFLIGLSLTGVQAKRYALIMGSNYTGNAAGIPPLELCEADAALMEQTLRANGSYDDVKVLLGRMVVATNVEQAMKQLASKVTSADTVAIYFSGHGTYGRDATAPNGIRNFIVMFDRPHVSDEQINEWMKGIKTQRVAFIFDCCYSGGIAKKGRKGAGDIPVAPGSDGIVIQNGDENFYFQNRAIIASSDSNETSIEVRGNINHGIFTYWFSQGLLPANGDLNRDGTVTALEAFEWSSRRVTQNAKEYNHAQNPQISGNAKGIFLAGKIVPVAPEPNKPEPPKPDPQKPEPQKPEPQKPEPEVVTPNIPNVEPTPQPNVNTNGNVTIATTILKSILSGTQTPDPMMTLRRMRGVDGDRKIKVRFSGKEYPTNVVWVDRAGLKAATGEDIPLGTYTIGRNGTPTEIQNRVALLQVTGVPAGVHEVQIEADDYPIIKENIGVENGIPIKEFIVASMRGTGSIRGKVFLKNVEQPLAGQTVWMPTVVGTNQVHKMKTMTDGSFWFLNLPPGKYYTIKATFEENLKLDNQNLVVKEGDTTKVDVILNSKNFK